MFELFSFQECLSAFIVLFAVIDIIGSIPIILTLKEQGRDVNPYKATLYSLALLVTFFFVGDMLLQLFQVDIASFALAGSVVIFLVALEMILDIEATEYTDYEVTPGETYYYYYKVLSTDLQEYDISNVVAATPLTTVGSGS